PGSGQDHGGGAAGLDAGLARSCADLTFQRKPKERNMLDHIGLRTKKFDALVAFYETCLKPLGYAKLSTYEGGAGFGKDGVSSLWIGASKEGPSSVHLAFESPTRKAVDAFYKAAIEKGAK